MEDENETCGVCSVPYNSGGHTPRVLIPCGHTLCSSCLTDIIQDPKLRKCPFDNSSFERTQNSVDHFPINFALLAVLENRSQQDLCRIHHKKLFLLCLQDNVKICSACELFGEHQGHRVRKIEDLKAKGLQAKKDLEESLTYLEENNQDFELSKKRCLGQIEKQFVEFYKIFKATRLDCRKKIEDFFYMSNPYEFSLTQETSRIIEEINQTCQKEENLAMLDRDFSLLISRLQPQVRKEEVSKLCDGASGMIDHLASFLETQTKSLKSFDLLNGKGKFEQPVVLKEKEKQQSQQVKTMFVLDIFEDFLLIRIKNPNPNPIPQEIFFDRYHNMKKLKVELEHYHFVYPDSPDLVFLSEVLYQLNNYTSLTTSFAPEGLTVSHAYHLLDLLFCKVQNLKDIEISFEQCKNANEPIVFFCDSILPRATSLQSLTLKLGFSSFDEKSLIALAQSLSLFSENLQSFTLRAERTKIADDGVEQIIYAVEEVKSLGLYLEGTGITDYSLKLFGERRMARMKNLDQLSLDVSGTKITMKGVNAVFTGVPKNINRLSLGFEGIRLPDQVISLFEKIVCPKLKTVNDVDLRLEGRELRDKASKLLERVRKDAAEERRKALESNTRPNSGSLWEFFIGETECL